MNFHIILWLCLQLSTGILGKIQRIVGGDNIHIREVPYQVSLRYYNDNQLICGGAIISEWHILTAAHCLLDRQLSNIKVYSGSNSIMSSKVGLAIQEVFIHPEFTGKKTSEESYIHDIAVILLQNALKFNKFQNKVKMPSRPSQTGERAIVTGWGLMSYPSELLSATLKKALMIVQDNFICAQTLSIAINDRQLCALYRKGVGACTGDSGGPLVSSGEIIGIASFVLPCGTGVPDVYTRVYPYVDYIQSILKP